MSGAPLLLHVATRAEWEAGRQAGEYRTGSLAAAGFIHLCLPTQLPGVARKWFQGKTGLVLLEIDPSKLTAPLRYEDSEGTGELFPHLFGPLNLNAVIREKTFEPA